MKIINAEKISKRDNPKYKKLRDFIRKGEKGEHYFTISLEDDTINDDDDDMTKQHFQQESTDTMINFTVTI